MSKGLAASKNFDPADYQLVGYFYCGTSVDIGLSYRGDHAAIEAALGEEEAAQRMSVYRCESCGTYYNHGAVVRNTVTGTLLSIGQNCAYQYFSLGSVAELRRRDAAKRVEARERRDRIAAEIADQFAANPGLEEVLEADHYIIRDLKSKQLQYGALSDKQVALAFKIKAEMDTRAAEAENTTWVEVPEGTQTVTGIILTTKYVDSQFGSTLKMLVKASTESGDFKVWGTVPAAIDDAEKGAGVTFVAEVERSKDDPYFGFYKRPRKAEVIEVAN